ncbi:MAG: hypothetical protein ACI9QL_002357 [Candidatus Omnitrophota bacterium]|jgi:hypothetical protein
MKPTLQLAEIPPELFILLGLLVGPLLLLAAIRKKRLQRLMADLPTSKTTGVFIGLNELKGKTRCDHPLFSFLAETHCVYYRYSVEEHWSRTVTESYTDSNGKRQTRTRRESGWTTIGSDEQMVQFRLVDASGEIRILPQGAQIEPVRIFAETCRPSDPLYYGKARRQSVSNSDHRRRFTEYGVTLDAPIYVLGQARERTDVVAAEIASAPDAPHFLISTRTEEEIYDSKRAAYWALAIGGLILCVGGVTLFDNTRYGQLAHPEWYALAGAGYLLLWLTSWTWMAANSVIQLKHRVEQAISLIDVQRLRRHELIPQLVACVNALSKHEQEVQTHLAELRTQQKLDGSSATPDIEHALISLVEAYPELKANGLYRELHQALIDTENRIALARNYYLEIATFYNTRQAIFPDKLVGQLVGARYFEINKGTEET